MSDFEGRAFTEKEWFVLKTLYSSPIPLTTFEVVNKAHKNYNFKIAWETCERILNDLCDEGFVTEKVIGSKKTIYSLNYEKKNQLKQKYKM